nr:MAG TPA: hypothetical protein [Bacteriophage sp.]
MIKIAPPLPSPVCIRSFTGKSTTPCSNTHIRLDPIGTNFIIEPYSLV